MNNTDKPTPDNNNPYTLDGPYRDESYKPWTETWYFKVVAIAALITVILDVFVWRK